MKKAFCFFVCTIIGLNTLASSLTSTYKKPSEQKIILSTFNIKWFGLGGDLWNKPEQEFRQNYLKRFVAEELTDSEIIIFTEVTNPSLLSDILKDRFECLTYDRGQSIRHQRVVACFDFTQYRAEKYDEDFEIPEVALGSSMQRPALQLKLCHRNGFCFLQILGVHLAAGQESNKRTEQITHLSEDLKKQVKVLPTLITGDFNSYTSEQNGLGEDDITLFESILSSNAQNFKSINQSIPTYYYGDWGKIYDHIVVSENIKPLAIHGYRACEKKPDLSTQFIPYYSFSRYFSDHCPLTAQLSIPEV